MNRSKACCVGLVLVTAFVAASCHTRLGFPSNAELGMTRPLTQLGDVTIRLAGPEQGAIVEYQRDELVRLSLQCEGSDFVIHGTARIGAGTYLLDVTHNDRSASRVVRSDGSLLHPTRRGSSGVEIALEFAFAAWELVSSDAAVGIDAPDEGSFMAAETAFHVTVSSESRSVVERYRGVVREQEDRP